MKQKLNKYLYQTRKKRGLTQQAVSDGIKEMSEGNIIPFSLVSRYELGYGLPSIKHLYLLINFYKLNLKYTLNLYIEAKMQLYEKRLKKIINRDFMKGIVCEK